jgi:hypothetical protein
MDSMKDLAATTNRTMTGTEVDWPTDHPGHHRESRHDRCLRHNGIPRYSDRSLADRASRSGDRRPVVGHRRVATEAAYVGNAEG